MGNPFTAIEGFLLKAGSVEGAAVRKEAEALRLEGKEEVEEAAVASEVGVFRGGLLAEDELIREIADLHNAKFTLVRGFMAASTMNARLSAAKKKLFSALLHGSKRVQANISAGIGRAFVGRGSPPQPSTE